MLLKANCHTPLVVGSVNRDSVCCWQGPRWWSPSQRLAWDVRQCAAAHSNSVILIWWYWWRQLRSANPKHVGETVKIGVWLTDKRSSGKSPFCNCRTGRASSRNYRKNDVSQKPLTWLSRHTRKLVSLPVKLLKTSVLSLGTKFTSVILKLWARVKTAIGNKEHGIDFLLDNRHLWLRAASHGH